MRKSAISSRSVALAMGGMFQRNILYRCPNCHVLLDEYSLWIRNNGPQQVLATAESHR
jgi:hypothetical protein